jgi:hypothetical protein
MQAILVAAVFAMLSMLMPPLTWLLTFISGGAIALVTLRVGIQKGLMVMLGAIAGSAFMAYLAVKGQVQLAAHFALLLWVPVWIAASVLRMTQSLAVTLQVIALLYSLTVAIVFVVMGNPVQYWMEMLEGIRPVLQKAYNIQDAEKLKQVMVVMAKMMTGAAAAYSGIVLILSLLVGRGWQAMLFNPGGLRDEFNQMRYGKIAGLLTLVVITASLMSGNDLLVNISIVLGMVYVFYGLAVVHGVLAKKTNGNFWLIGLYVLFLLAAQLVVPVLMVLALSDTWVNYRARFVK